MKPENLPTSKGGEGGGSHSARALTEEAISYLLEVVRSRPEGRQLSTGVAAAGRILEHAQWVHEHTMTANFVAYLGGPVAAARWLAENRERLEASLASGDPMGLLVSPSAPGEAESVVLESGVTTAEGRPREGPGATAPVKR